MRPGQPHANLDFASVTKGMCCIAKVVRGNHLHQFARLRPHHTQDRFRSRQVGDHRKRLADMPPQPCQIALQSSPRHHREISRLRQPGYRQIAFNPAARIQHLGVDDPPDRHIHLIAADKVEKTASIAALDPDLAKRGQVKDPNRAPDRQMFRALVGKPVLPLPAILIFRHLPRIGEPIRPFPAGNLAKDRTPGLQMRMQRRAPHAARGRHLPIGIMVGVQQAQSLRHPFFQILTVALERLRPADINLPQIERSFAFHDPMRQSHARTARSGNPHRVIASRHPIAAKLRRLTQIIPVIRGKALRSVEKCMDARGLEQRHPHHRRLKNRLKMVPIRRQSVEHEVVADPGHAPGLGFRLKRPDHHLARIAFVVGAFVRHPQHRQMAKALNWLGNQIEMLASVQRQSHAGRRSQFAPPHAAAVHHDIAGDMPRRAVGQIVHPGHPAVGLGHPDHLGMLKNRGPPQPRALGQSHRDIGRIALAIARQMHRADHTRHIKMRIHRLDFARRNLGDINIENPRHRGLAQQFLMPRWGQRHGNRPDLPHAGLYPGLGRQLPI